MKKQEKVKRYSKIYKNSLRKKRSAVSLIFFYLFLFVTLAVFSYFVSMAVSSFLNRPRCTKIGPIEDYNSQLEKVGNSTNSNGENLNNFENNENNSQFNNQYLEINGEEVDLKTASNDRSFKNFLEKIKNKNAVVVCLKGDDGKLVYDSNLKIAKNWDILNKSEVNSNKIDFKELVEKIKESGFIPIARISAFFDQLAPCVDFDNSFVFEKNTSEGVNEKVNVFSAFNGVKRGKWLNAVKPSVRAYISDIAAEVMRLGFAYVLIDNVCFPVFRTRKELENSDAFDNELKMDALVKFIGDLRKKGVNFILSYPAKAIYDYDLARSLFGGVDFLNKFKKHAPFFENEGEIKKCEKTFLKLSEFSDNYFVVPRLNSSWNNSSKVKNLLKNCSINSSLVVK